MHYTSIENIHKVIDPLFLDDLRREFKDIKELKQVNVKQKRLEEFQKKLASLKFLEMIMQSLIQGYEKLKGTPLQGMLAFAG